MHYHMGSSTSSHSHTSWASHNVQPGTQRHARWSASPAPPTHSIPNAPHLHTVSLPHPNSTPYRSPTSYQFERSSTPYHSLIVLHPLLSYGPNLRFNVTRSIAEVQLRPGCSPAMLRESAVQPQVSHMTMTIPCLPALIIEVVNPRGVTVNDVLARICEILNRNVPSHEMHRSSRGGSVKYIDLLGSKVFFAGLTRVQDGSDRWDIHLLQNV